MSKNALTREVELDVLLRLTRDLSRQMVVHTVQMLADDTLLATASAPADYIGLPGARVLHTVTMQKTSELSATQQIIRHGQWIIAVETSFEHALDSNPTASQSTRIVALISSSGGAREVDFIESNVAKFRRSCAQVGTPRASTNAAAESPLAQ